MIRLLQLSDLHFGPPYVEAAGDAILEHLKKHAFEAVIITGDLTQRARRKQFVQARRFLEQLSQNGRPLLVIPGNHDLPLFRIWERIFQPYHLYQSLISAERNPVLEIPGLTVVGVDSTHPLLRISNGRLGTRKLEFIKKMFEKSPVGNFRIVALHHPLLFVQDSKLLSIFLDSKVDLVLSGHAHSRLTQKISDSKGRSLLLAQCGTSSSSRGREGEVGKNSINEIVIDSDFVEVRLLELAASLDFEKMQVEKYARTR